MIPVRVPIIDYENPCYCPNPLQVHSTNVSHSDPSTSPSSFSRNPTTTLAYSQEGEENCNFDARKNSSSLYALTYGRKRVTNYDHSEKALVGRRFAHVSYDSSPCARYTCSAGEPIPFKTPDREWKEPIKQEYSSPVLPAPLDQDEQIRQVLKEGYEKVPENIATTRTLLLRLDKVFPRIGFREAADSIHHVWLEINAEYRFERHQALVDLLADRGALNEYVMTALHDAEFRHLDLGPTMSGINKLNLPGGNVMRVFRQPGWFRHLRALSFAGGSFQNDHALTQIQSLRQIERLVLAYTGIGNEGVFHIVALKHNLRYLDLTGNVLINDDSMPALILLENLQFLSVFETGVLMPGLRKLAVAVKGGKHVMDIVIPTVCKDYINGIHEQYLLHPLPPLISDPDIVSTLSKTALSHNLTVHASVNSSIVSSGPREEMEVRLWKILDMRRQDLVVREMLVGQDEAR